MGLTLIKLEYQCLGKKHGSLTLFTSAHVAKLVNISLCFFSSEAFSEGNVSYRDLVLRGPSPLLVQKNVALRWLSALLHTELLTSIGIL